jgi:hypothetical protein
MGLRMEPERILDLAAFTGLSVDRDFLTWALEEFELVNAYSPETIRLTARQVEGLETTLPKWVAVDDPEPGGMRLELRPQFMGIPIETLMGGLAF